MSDVFLYLLFTPLAWALCADGIALAVSIQRRAKGAGVAAGTLLLFDGLPLAIALAPGGYGWCEYVGYGVLSLHLFAISIAASVDPGRIVGLHILATVFFCAHLFFLVNAP